jgi:HTH-type transcriptional regulator / antitoxin HigA
MSENTALERSLLSPPGDTIQETLDRRGMSQRELAVRMGKNPKNINQMIKGKESISQGTAILLERVLGIPASFWLERERQYRQILTNIEAEESLLDDQEWLHLFPLREMSSLQWIESRRDVTQNLKNLLSFFGIASPKQWNEIYIENSLTVSFRISLAHTNNPGAISAWLRKGELLANELSLKAYDRRAFVRVLKEVRSLVVSHPMDLKEQLQRLCAEAGVAVVFTPCLPKAPINGASRWIRNGTVPLIQLSCRYKTNDIFWFSFFHEAGHILKHGKKGVFLEDVRGAQIGKAKEREADAYASEALVPRKRYSEFRARGQFTEATVRAFAESCGTHPGIVVGRLQYDRALSQASLNHMKNAVEV